MTLLRIVHAECCVRKILPYRQELRIPPVARLDAFERGVEVVSLFEPIGLPLKLRCILALRLEVNLDYDGAVDDQGRQARGERRGN